MKSPMVKRFNRTERFAHWTNALGFLVCLVTGVMIALKERLNLQGDLLERTRDVHLVAAICFVSIPLAVWIIGHTPSLFRWIGGALHWGLDDIVWLLYPLLKVFWWPLKIPQAGRFNAGQKINMIGMTTLKWVLLASGLFMWKGHGHLTAFYVHLMAFFLTLPLLLGHLFMAVVNPRSNHSLRGMITGWVRLDWAKHHHGKWIARSGKTIEIRGDVPEESVHQIIDINTPPVAETEGEMEEQKCESL